MRPRRIHPLLAALALGAAAPVLPAQTPDPAWDSVTVAWDAGNYPDALIRIERLLAGPDAHRWLERAALLTGELYVTTDVAPDGRAVRWSPGGRHAAVERGTGAARRTLLFRWDSGALRQVGEVAGYGLVFAPGDGFAAYVTAEGMVRDRALADGTERNIPVPGLRPRVLAYGPDGTLYVSAASDSDTTADIYALGPATPAPLVQGVGGKTMVAVVPGALIYTIDRDRVAVRRADGATFIAPGSAPALSADGRTLAWVGRDGDSSAIMVLPLADGGAPRALVRSARSLAAPAVSRDGSRVAFQMMPREDWEIYVVDAAGGPARRLTREIQHDLLPQFVTDDMLLEKIGEARHRRSYLLDLRTGERTRLFHNNTVRTVAPEYAWAPSPDGSRILIVADRDGNTISPERGVYLTDLERRVSVADVLARVRASLAAERDLRQRGQRAFAPIAAAVRTAVADVSVPRIDRYAHALFAFDSKFITRPGNRMAIDYLAAQLRGFGYEPVIQEFEPRPGVPSANVIATLRGTTDPDLTYVVSSHFDSVEGGPGADDDASGSTALLETARVLAGRPQRASIQFAFFTGEEAGLLGSRYFVRRAVADSVRIVGALNNDMIGFRNDHRFDNTIRYSNDGLRDLQHAAAFLFTDLVTYDSRYYQNTDAHAYYDAYGDIVGGIGSYPILGNPHYHQSHDVLETIDQRLVGEVAKTTVATLMLMASSPSRLAGLAAAWENDHAVATWRPAVESGVSAYRVAYGPAASPERRTITVRGPRAVLPGAQAGWSVAVKAVFPNGLESWDWARTTLPER